MSETFLEFPKSFVAFLTALGNDLSEFITGVLTLPK